MDKVEDPNCVKKRIDMKLTNIFCASNAIEYLKNDAKVNLDKNTQITILTSSAMITGQVVFENSIEKNSDPELLINIAVEKSIDKMLEKGDKVLVNNVAVICIKNAVVIPFSNSKQKTKFGVLNIFTDQILGFSYGVLSTEPQV